LGVGETLKGRLMLYNSLRMQFKEVRVRKNPKCELCGEHATIHALMEDYGAFCGLTAPALQLPGAVGAAADGNGNGAEISPRELKQVLDTGRPVTLLDVREPHEWDIARIDSAQLAPLSKFDQFIPELDPSGEIYLYCYKGKRSLTALKKLQERGFTHLKSLSGGIDRWSQEVDPRVPRY
jgi:adenylyltransferase/sulfurtransferase